LALKNGGKFSFAKFVKYLPAALFLPPVKFCGRQAEVTPFCRPLLLFV